MTLANQLIQNTDINDITSKKKLLGPGLIYDGPGLWSGI